MFFRTYLQGGYIIGSTKENDELYYLEPKETKKLQAYQIEGIVERNMEEY